MKSRKLIALSGAALAAIALSFVVLAVQKGDDFPIQPVPAVHTAQKIVVVGNSLTFHGPKPASGWFGRQGMAASSVDRDYAHLLIAHLGIPDDNAYIRNFYPFETSDVGAKANIKSLADVLGQRPAITILELGDNVKPYRLRDVFYFRENYRTLAAQAAKSSGKLYCLSTFWRKRLIDWVIKSACDEYGGIYVDIGDIYDNPGNPDRLSRNFPDPGVDKHPKDHSMQEIATRLEAAIASR